VRDVCFVAIPTCLPPPSRSIGASRCMICASASRPTRTPPVTLYSPIKIISSMATRQLLADLVALRPPGAMAVEVESVGGVDAARRVRAGEAFDAIVLAANVVDQLIAEGHALPGSRVDIVQSGVFVAVRSGAPAPDIASEQAVRDAVLNAPSLGYSTGPSGVYLTGLFERWGILEAIRPRIVQAPAGVPVGSPETVATKRRNGMEAA